MARKQADESQRKYIARRDTRIEELFLREGFEPRDIATKMLAETSLASDSDESAVRTVRGVVAKIRKRIDGARNGDAGSDVAANEIDVLERKLKRWRDDLTWQEMVAAGEPDAEGKEAQATTIIDGPQGTTAIIKAKWPTGKRIDAKKEARILADKIADLEVLITTKRDAERDRATAGGDVGGLTIIESEKSIQELIEQNLNVVN